jgi:hypothetical protein
MRDMAKTPNAARPGTSAKLVYTGEKVLISGYRIVYPNGGETVHQGDTLVIRWEASDDAPMAVLRISLNNGKIWAPVTPYGSIDPQAGVYSWVIPEVIGTDQVSTVTTQAKIKIEAYVGAGLDMSDAPFSIVAAAHGAVGRDANHLIVNQNRRVIIGDGYIRVRVSGKRHFSTAAVFSMSGARVAVGEIKVDETGVTIPVDMPRGMFIIALAGEKETPESIRFLR